MTERLEDALLDAIWVLTWWQQASAREPQSEADAANLRFLSEFLEAARRRRRGAVVVRHPKESSRKTPLRASDIPLADALLAIEESLSRYDATLDEAGCLGGFHRTDPLVERARNVALEEIRGALRTWARLTNSAHVRISALRAAWNDVVDVPAEDDGGDDGAERDEGNSGAPLTAHWRGDRGGLPELAAAFVAKLGIGGGRGRLVDIATLGKRAAQRLYQPFANHAGWVTRESVHRYLLDVVGFSPEAIDAALRIDRGRYLDAPGIREEVLVRQQRSK